MHLEIYPLHFRQVHVLDALCERLEAEFGLGNRTCEFDFKLDRAYDLQRRQYNASHLWQQVLAANRNTTHKLLVLTDFDLFIPVLTFVFGEAQLGGRAGIVSSCRLQETFYGLPPNSQLLFDRLLKEAVHEIGHLFGLHHCYRPGCVMGPSTNVEAVDMKSDKFCLECLQHFAQARDAM